MIVIIWLPQYYNVTLNKSFPPREMFDLFLFYYLLLINFTWYFLLFLFNQRSVMLVQFRYNFDQSWQIGRNVSSTVQHIKSIPNAFDFNLFLSNVSAGRMEQRE